MTIPEYPITREEMYLDAIAKGSGGGDISVVPLTVTENKKYTAPSGTAYSPVTVNVPAPAPTLVPKTVTENGTYAAEDDNADGYSIVTVDVAGGDTNVFQYLEFTPVTDATSTNRLDVQTDVVPSGTSWLIICAPKTLPQIPPTGENTALIFTAGSSDIISTRINSILRAN
jgi:hypothetical protein